MQVTMKQLQKRVLWEDALQFFSHLWTLTIVCRPINIRLRCDLNSTECTEMNRRILRHPGISTIQEELFHSARPNQISLHVA